MNNRSDTTTVLLIDTNTAFLNIAHRLLREYYYPHFMIVGISSSANDALSQAQQLQPGIILLGTGQHSLENLRLIPRLRLLLPSVGIIVLGSLDINIYRQLAISLGANAFIGKIALNTALLPTMQRLCATNSDTLSFAPDSSYPRVNSEGQHIATEGQRYG